MRQRWRQRERSLAGCPPLGGWRKDERASRKDILSALVRLWPVLCYMSLVACLRHEHMFLTSPFFSDHPLCLTTDPTQADTERRSDTCFSSPGTVASQRRTHSSVFTLTDEMTGWRLWCLNYRMQKKILASFAFVCLQVDYFYFKE